MPLRIRPAAPDLLEDVVRLFGPSGAYGNCWCTWWILSAGEFERADAGERRAMLEEMIEGGEEPGLLAYDGEEPVGWVAAGPRTRYARMMSRRSRAFRPFGDDSGWVINCFFIPPPARRRGIARFLLRAAVDHAFEQGAAYIDAYPLDPDVQATSTATLFVGSLSMFLDEGFEEITRMGKRPLVRLDRARAS